MICAHLSFFLHLSKFVPHVQEHSRSFWKFFQSVPTFIGLLLSHSVLTPFPSLPQDAPGTLLESRTGSWEAATATALSPTEGVREWASVSPPIPIVEASQHSHKPLRFIIYINVIRVEGKDTQHELTPGTYSSFWYIIVFAQYTFISTLGLILRCRQLDQVWPHLWLFCYSFACLLPWASRASVYVYMYTFVCWYVYILRAALTVTLNSTIRFLECT